MTNLLLLQKPHSYGYSNIPSEILLSILSRLDSTHDLLSCAQVCKLWSYFATELLWYKPNLEVLKSSNRWTMFFSIIQAKSTLFPYALFVRRINLSPLSLVIEDLHIMALRYCKRLERLTLAGCSKLTDIGLCTLIEDVGAALISIDLSDVDQVTDKTIRHTASHCPQLQGINLSMSKPQHGITDASIQQLAYSCNNLRRVRFNRCVQITRESIVPLVIYCPRLMEIDLTNCAIDDTLLTSIFEHSHELKELRIGQADLTHTALTETPFCLAIQQPNSFQQLRFVDLTNIAILTDQSLTRLIHAAPKIRNLILNRCSSITDEGALTITQLGRYLRCLHLGHCPLLTDKSISRIVTSCNRIRYLDLASCTQITDQSMLEIAKSLSRLRRIGLVKCDRLTDMSLEALVYYHADIHDSLERIHLSYCTQLSTKGVAKLLNVCSRLNHLSLTHVPSFLRNDLKAFCRAPPKGLTELQNQVFCVFSGDAIGQLRDHLNRIYEEDFEVLHPLKHAKEYQRQFP
ncbi:hypothetical protein EDC96DRAFT_497303 [Choanephora cucurbitarum]|nr:hypothetical protein EDC96DRAFT_497303 [Choanephora cucurbitarum]